MLRRSSPRVVLALAAGLLCGCPKPTPPAAPPAPAAAPPVAPPRVGAPAPVAPPDRVVPPAPAPKDASAAWERAATRQTNWRIGIAKALKPEAERKALLAPFASPSPELERLLALARAFPCAAPELGHAANLGHRLERALKDPTLSGSVLTQERSAACGLLLLADANTLLRERFLLTAQGWQSPRQGLSDKSFSEARAKALLEGVELARDSRWPEATPLLSAALRAEAAATTKASGLAAADAAWAEVEAGWSSLDLEALRAALQRWSAAFARKGLTGPASRVKKG